MKKLFMYLTIAIITFMAVLDAKDRIKELDEISANTPSQVEMNQMMNRPDSHIKQNFIPEYNSNFNQNQQNNMNFDINQNKQNQLDNIEKRRNSIPNLVK